MIFLVFSYERDASAMSKAKNLKAGEMSKIHFLVSSRSLCFRGIYDFIS